MFLPAICCYLINSSDSSDNELYAGMIHDMPLNSVNPLNDEWVVHSKIYKTVNFQIDTGARCNVILQDTFRSFGIKTALKLTYTKLTFSEHKLKPIVILQLLFKIQGNNFDIDFYIVDSSLPSVLGGSTCRETGLIQRLLKAPISMKEKVKTELLQMESEGVIILRNKLNLLAG